jgi:hypothetical protein
MKKFSLIVFVLLVFFTSLAFGGKVSLLPELLEPNAIIIGSDEIIVPDGINVYIYSLSDYQLKKRFGKAGKGPGEFNPDTRVDVYLQSNSIIVNCYDLVHFFSRDGNYIKTLKTVRPHIFFKPFGDGFVGQSRVYEEKTGYNAINIYDSNLQMVKEIHRMKHMYQKGKTFVLTSPVQYHPYKDRIFVPGKDQKFIIDVYDKDGKHLFAIEREYKRIKVTEVHREDVLDTYRKHSTYKAYFDIIKKELQFPEFLTAIREINVSDNKVYVLTYKLENDKSEFFIYDTDGKFIKKMMMPFKQRSITTVYPYTVKNEKLYQLIENEETEKWELHVNSFE